MFSLDNFYYVMYYNFLQPHGLSDMWFRDFGSVAPEDLAFFTHTDKMNRQTKAFVWYYDQEPLFKKSFENIIAHYPHPGAGLTNTRFKKILANSEHSDLKQGLCKEYGYIDWYYFFHGFAALEWYRDFKYLPKIENTFSKVFISLNNLMTKDRSYRLSLVANLIDKDLDKYGHISCPLKDQKGDWKSEILDSNSLLSRESKKLIYKSFSNRADPLIVDTNKPYGALSAKLNLKLHQSGLWNIVGETIFYHDKLHLTEKTFKPIVSRRPFILVAAPGNLAYLKSYGFKTFDRWIDESYDCEPDPDRRIAKIIDQIESLCKLDPNDLNNMHKEMQEVLDFNFNHFYSDFKKIIITEMTNNFEKCLRQGNVGFDYQPDEKFDISKLDRNSIVSRLMK